MQKLACLAFVVALALQGAACAGRQARSAPGGGSAKTAEHQRYPPRPAGCALTLLHAPAPTVADWDDLGVAEVTCHIDIGLPQCLRLFRAEACRRGGDIVYDLPEKPLRPREQAVVYRGRVAHSRAATPPPTGDHQDNPKPYSNSGE